MTASINVDSTITSIRANHVWTDSAGVTRGSLSLGASWIAFDDPDQVRDIGQKLLLLASAMEDHAATHAVLATPDRTPLNRTE
jgi:hypothetical protein